MQKHFEQIFIILGIDNRTAAALKALEFLKNPNEGKLVLHGPDCLDYILPGCTYCRKKASQKAHHQGKYPLLKYDAW